MNKLENIRLNGYHGTWYEIDRRTDYILFESEQWGDEAAWIVTNGNLEPIDETYDGLEEFLEEM